MRQKSEQFNSDTGKQPIFLLLNRPIGKHPNKWVWVVSKLKCGSPLFVPSKHFFFQLNQIRPTFVHIETYLLILQYQDPRTFYIQCHSTFKIYFLGLHKK